MFLLIVWSAYLCLPLRGQNVLLLAASYYFYAQWDWRFLSLIWISTLVDYVSGRVMAASSQARVRRLALMVSLVTNLGLLGVFKYANFFVDSAQALLDSVGLPTFGTALNIVLPVGISFYTFQTMSYSIDVYRRQIPATRNLLDFALFVAFFPQLVAGPIERAKHLLPVLSSRRHVGADEMARGLFLIVLGFMKKVTIADGVASRVDAIYATSADVSGGDVAIATYLFAIQILCDFSAYTDIARGTAKLFGIDLMINFDAPYFSRGPSEFWQRWHISLSTWLRDYLYIPLGGNRGPWWFVYRNLMVTMVLGGLWHGAAWNFVLWGIYQGTVLCLFRVVTRNWGDGVDRAPESRSGLSIGQWVWRAIAMVLFFQVTCYGWLLFRAESLDQIIRFTALLVDVSAWGDLMVRRPPFGALLGIVFLVVWEWLTFMKGSATFYRRWHPLLRGMLLGVILILLAMGMSNASSAFIYFQF